jgi:hypothetical protein
MAVDRMLGAIGEFGIPRRTTWLEMTVDGSFRAMCPCVWYRLFQVAYLLQL